jgi:hypothetical protein
LSQRLLVLAKLQQKVPAGGGFGLCLGAVGDFDDDGSWDLTTVMADGDLYCYFSEWMKLPGVRLRVAGDLTGPVTASCWTTGEHPVCKGTVPVFDHWPIAYLAVRRAGKYQIQYHLAEAPAQHRQVIVLNGRKDVVLDVPER